MLGRGGGEREKRKKSGESKKNVAKAFFLERGVGGENFFFSFCFRSCFSFFVSIVF